jgi:uncharacterized lipoprotein YajG
MLNYQSKYSIAFYDAENKLMKLSWFTSSEELSEATLKEEMKSILIHIKDNSPNKIIVDTLNFRYQVTQSIQNWIVSNFINKVFLLGVEKYAIVVEDEVYDEVKIQQVDSEDDEEESALIQYFTDDEDAFDWLLSLD